MSLVLLNTKRKLLTASVINTLTRNEDEAVIDKVAGIAGARNKIDHIHWYVPHYTPSIQQQSF